MRSLFRLSSLPVLVVLLAAIGFLYQINTLRARRVTYVSGLAQTVAAAVDPASPTGYAGGLRQLIVPEHNNDSYQWIAQTQQMLARGEWHVRHVDYDNAPAGRDIRSPSPYRWWLGIVAYVEHQRTGQPLPAAVEAAALAADPVLQVGLLVLSVVVTAWWLGPLPAALLGAGLALLFPFSSAFLPGQPGDYGLSLGAALWSVLPLLAGRPTPAAADPVVTARGERRRFFLAGLAGGGGLWLSVSREGPILLGLAAGAIVASVLTRRDAAPPPWRAWALGGAVATLAAFLLEYLPANLELGSWRLDTVHPLYALAWLAGGELLALLGRRLRPDAPPWGRRHTVVAGVALLVAAALPAAILVRDHGWLTADALAFRLTNLSGGATASSLAAWLARDQVNAALFAVLLPLLLLGPAVGLLVRRATAPAHRTALALALGPVAAALVLACCQLRWWNLVDATLLGVIVAVAAALAASPRRWLWAGATAAVLVPGVFQLLPRASASTPDAVTEGDVEALVERDLAHWLAHRVGPDGAVVLAPPGLTTSLYFHGGLRGLGTPYPDNKDGFAAAVRLAAASSADEAQALVRKRGVTHVVLPSWDPFLDEYARLGSNQPEHTLIGLLHQWLPPRWLRPVPYHLPQIAGFEGQSVVVFEVVDVQDNTTALSHLAEYFAEMGQPEPAAAVSQALEHAFPADLGGLVARAQVANSRQDGPAFSGLVQTLLPRLAEDEAQSLPWDRRVSLAIVLAEDKKFDAARDQVKRCLVEIDEPGARSLSTLALYRLLVLGRIFNVPIADAHLRDVVRGILPVELRAELDSR